MTRNYELKLSDGNVIVWSGDSGEDAAKKYVTSHPNTKVIATRNVDRHGVFQVNVSRINIIP